MMVKKIAAVVLILLTGGTWFYLDYLNKQEILAAEQSRQAMEQARAQAKARAEALAAARAKFEADIATELTACKATAEQAKTDYVTQHQVPVRKKPGQFTIPKAVADEATKMLETANAACQTTYDTRLANGS
ncbi:MAG TPA: hypothetical protein VK149_11495 [Sideroxyarcus sp.]|nr:hypothetical protein [Sideroxyarcus sp.]